MGVPVVLENVNGCGFRATGAGGLSVGLAAEGATAAEALERLADQVNLRVSSGARLTELSVPVPTHLGDRLADAGCLRDEPLYDAWRQAMEENRRALDEDPDSP
jgi:hypothetical protein